MKRKRKPHPNVFPKLLKFFVLPIEKVFCALSDYAEMQNKANLNRASVQSIIILQKGKFCKRIRGAMVLFSNTE
jgi:hypothetical protein